MRPRAKIITVSAAAAGLAVLGLNVAPAQAAKPTPPPVSLTVTRVTVIADRLDSYSATATCPAGQVVVGGGGQANDQNAGGQRPISMSRPEGDNGWTVQAQLPWAGSIHFVEADALCVPGTAVTS